MTDSAMHEVRENVAHPPPRTRRDGDRPVRPVDVEEQGLDPQAARPVALADGVSRRWGHVSLPGR